MGLTADGVAALPNTINSKKLLEYVTVGKRANLVLLKLLLFRQKGNDFCRFALTQRKKLASCF